MEQHYRSLTSKLSSKKDGLELSAFVAGPFIDPAWFDDCSAVTCNATRARIAIIKALKELDVGIVIGEHSQLEVAAREVMGEWVDASSSEIFAAKECDFIVVLPSSPGSFCELGSWHILEWAARKMLVIVDKKFEHEKSYLSEGVFPRAKMNSSQVEYLSYEKLDDIISTVTRYYGRISANKAFAEAVHGGRR